MINKKERRRKYDGRGEGRERRKGREEGGDDPDNAMLWIKWASYPRIDLEFTPIPTFLSVPKACSTMCVNLENVCSFSKMQWPWKVMGKVFAVLIWHLTSRFSRLLEIWVVWGCGTSLVFHRLSPFTNLFCLSFHPHPQHTPPPAFTPRPPHLISQEGCVTEKHGRAEM